MYLHIYVSRVRDPMSSLKCHINIDLHILTGLRTLHTYVGRTIPPVRFKRQISNSF